MGSIPVGDSDFFLVLPSCDVDYFILITLSQAQKFILLSHDEFHIVVSSSVQDA